MDDDQRSAATPAEVREALAALAPTEMRRLYGFGKALLFGDLLGLDAHGLFHEAVARALHGTRTWPRHTPFVVFVKGAMESIVDEYREKRLLRPEGTDPEGDIADRGANALYGHAGFGLGAEAGLLWAELEQLIIGLFDGKDHARVVLNGLMKGETPDEICTANQLTETQYDSARRAISRERARIYAILGRKEKS